MNVLIILIVACLACLFLIIFGAVMNQPGVLSTGTGILGVLLGWIGAKNQPALSSGLRKAACLLGLHEDKFKQEGAHYYHTCQRPGCTYHKQVHI